MKIFFYAAILILWFIGFIAILYNPRFRLRRKLLFFILGLSALSYSLWYQETEKYREKIRQEMKDLTLNKNLEKINKSFEDYKKKEQEGLLQGSDYLRYITLYLEKLDINISGIRRLFRKDFILDYFTDIEKIPNYLTFEEWKDIEGRVYQRNVDRIKGDFNARGLSLSNAEPHLTELKEVRDKVLKAKEEDLSKNTENRTK